VAAEQNFRQAWGWEEGLTYHAELGIALSFYRICDPIEELLELPQQPLTDFIREKITKLRLMLKSQPHLSPNDQETLVNIDALYEDWRNQTLQEGRKEGRKEGDRTALESMLLVKFGTIDRTLATVIPALLELSPIDRVRAVMELSQEDIIRNFGQQV
jgi:hypothetical protein